ncbi:MAG: zinc-ribbon domain-containing protein [Candidatus Hydrothermarchaeales archaeon]
MLCPRCGEQIADISRFCMHCGSKIAFCPSCGDTIEAIAKFCMHCGVNLSDYIAKEKIPEIPAIPKKKPKIEEAPKVEEAAPPIKEVPPAPKPEVVEEAPKVEEVAPPAKEEPPVAVEEAAPRERAFEIKERPKSRFEGIVAETRAKLFQIVPKGRKVDDYVIIDTIEKCQSRRGYKTLDELRSDVIKELRKNYHLGKEDETFINVEIEKRGYTGKFRIDDVLAEKVGGRGRLAAIVAIVIPVVLFVGASVFGDILLPMFAEKLMNEPPIVQIQEPINNLQVSYGQPLTFIGTSEDKEDDVLPGSSMHWQSSIDGDLGTGNSIGVDALSVGVHTITLTGTDSQGKSTSQSIVLEILARGLIYELNLDKIVVVNGKEEKAYIKVWEPLINPEAPKKGWLEMENPFYKIKVNLDRSYYLLYDKINQLDLFVFNDRVENPIDMLTGSDIGYADHSGENVVQFSTTGRDDVDGIGRHQILGEDRENGFLLVTTEGWDFITGDITRGYDAEAEVLFGLFADKPYFINADEFNNLQNLGIVQEQRSYRNPDEVIHSWVLTGKYDSAVIKGGDLDHLNQIAWEPFYEVQTVPFKGRKVWHDGSATFSKMFPTHRLIGDRFGGAIIFSLPEGKFRFDDSLAVYGDQVTTEYIIGVETPEKATAFTTETVNEYAFFYDPETYQYPESMQSICTRYGLICPERPLDPHLWTTKRYAYVITLTKDWYDGETNQARDETWALADRGLADFKRYEDTISKQMEKTAPLAAAKLGGTL